MILKFVLIYFLMFITNLIFGSPVLCDAPFFAHYFQDPATPCMEGTLALHDTIEFFLTYIAIFIVCILGETLFFFKENKNERIFVFIQEVNLEIGWTLIPALLLGFIGTLSISQLYSSEEITSSQLDITIIGNQWYWTYEFMAFTKKISIESHMVDSATLCEGEFRNLEVDNSLILPIKTNIRLLLTSNDVLHSWAVPSLGIKVDAIPGRLNSAPLYIQRCGRYYGQCSEICGKGHGEMPIVVESVMPAEYNTYLHYTLVD